MTDMIDTSAGATGEASARDYKDTLFLPTTDFPMRAGLPKAEPKWLERWNAIKLYEKMRATKAGQERFVLHDGPPYANGHIHIGTGLNKILKDFVIRTQRMSGKDAPYRPGWDCHGLPIEWKVEQAYREKGKRKDDIPMAEFRRECRAYAQKWLDVQREEFKRLGVEGEWHDPYTTMAYDAEAAIVNEFLTFVEKDLVYRGSMPVMWSPVEQTALAEAEVEYQDKVSTQIWVRFPLRAVKQDGVAIPHALAGAHVVIWTTTPWTIPANRAVCYSKAINYGLYEVTAVDTEMDFMPWTRPGDKLIVADNLWEDVAKVGFVKGWRRLSDVNPEGLICSHPFAKLDRFWDYRVPMFAGDHVTADAGTGFVHTAPGHGADDYVIWMQHKDWHDLKEPIPHTVGPDGAYLEHIPFFAGEQIIRTEGKKAGQDGNANKLSMAKLIEAGLLLGRAQLTHSYPHSWRSKAPVIFRNTAQWFIAIDKAMEDGETLRDTALRAIDDTQWTPAVAKNRIKSMVEGRPDWLISRQRAWGVPLTLFVNKATGEILRDPDVNARIIAAVREGGADAWFEHPASEFLGEAYNADAFEQVFDILDVWFDSGSTHAFALREGEWPADVYLEGSDQHRGWFQSSLLESCGTRGRAPYKQVLTHGFTMAEDGRKMSKSLGNTVAPAAVAEKYGADILRLWAASSDYSGDLRIGEAILQSSVDAYRKLRNTLRYLLGALHGFSEDEAVELAQMPSLERFMLHRLSEVDEAVRKAYAAYDFKRAWAALFNFCVNDLSAFYLDVRKDSLYCDRPDAIRRRSARTVMAKVFEHLTLWLAPLLPFTAEEAWQDRFASEDGSVHLMDFAPVPAEWRDEARADNWAAIRRLRRVVTGALELERREKRIGSSLEAAPVVYSTHPSYAEALKAEAGDEVLEDFLADMAITSQARLVEGALPQGAFTLDDVSDLGVVVEKAQGRKCSRSWRIRQDVGADARYPDLSVRDADAVAHYDGVN
ncbi:isoleucine--tRNA ligase [Woodsholea maritima]|uniref:isoleucine--tRNA ligase n=1 Tax=Woodsholea maritima TaxID=240237 RepID=UPI00037563F2|nr:isoleucine--tRNA ligase [Woodsholea maritima]